VESTKVQVKGAYTWYWGFEVTSSSQDRWEEDGVDVLERGGGIEAVSSTGLKLINSGMQEVGGAQRKMFLFGGQLHGIQVAHVAVALTGSGYRLALIVHMLASAAKDQAALVKTLEEIFTRRVILPS